MRGDGDYIVLTKDNVERVMELTGRTEDELRAMYQQAENYGQIQIFWREYGSWFNFRANREFEYNGTLDEILSWVLHKPARRLE